MGAQQKQKFIDTQALFACPLCGGGMTVNGGQSLVCGGGHCFDIAAKGYVNFIPNQKPTRYTETLFCNRRAVLQAGFFDGVLNGVAAMLDLDANPMRILDAGCGDGYYALSLSQTFGGRAEVFALDLSREAVMMAAKGGNAVRWMAADLTHIPLKKNTMDYVLNILSPANYAEFSRILKDGGRIIKAVPGEKHLAELREKAAVKNRVYSNKRVTDYFEEHFQLQERTEICQTFPVSAGEMEQILLMTPLTFGVRTEEMELPDTVTIHIEIISGIKKP